MMKKLVLALALGATVTCPVIAQRNRQPAAPVLTGIDALRAEFRTASGSNIVYFGDDSAGIGAPARAVLAAQALWIRQHPEVVVSVEGYADPSDTRDRALAIAARRAAQVRDYLILMGVPSTQVSATSWGKERTTVTGLNPAALAQSRRVETVLVR